MVIGLLASSSAVLLLTGCEGDRLRDFIMSRAIFAPPADEGPKPWTVGPEMICCQDAVTMLSKHRPALWCFATLRGSLLYFPRLGGHSPGPCRRML